MDGLPVESITTTEHPSNAKEPSPPSKSSGVHIMTKAHRITVAGAVIVAFVILAGILLGNGRNLPFDINTSQDIRTICLALWAFAVPSWWTLEEEVWPGSAQNQKGARVIWLVVGGIVLIMIGAAPPK